MGHTLNLHMVRYSVNKIKGYFSVVVVILVAVMIGGTFVFTHESVQAVFQPHISRRYVDKTLDYLHYTFAGPEAVPEVAIVTKNFPTLLAERGPAKSVPVLIYHGVVNKPDGANVVLEDFRQQMFALKQAGYETVGLEDFQKFLRAGQPLPDKTFLLTFDDGRRDSYYPVDPILQSLGYRAVNFIITEHTLSENSSYYLSKEEVKAMVASGRWDIGSHGNKAHQYYPIDADGMLGHFMSNKLWLASENRLETDAEFKTRITTDLTQSKQELENALGIPIATYAYPFGDYGQGTINFPDAEAIVLAAVEAVYDMAFYQLRGSNDYDRNYSGRHKFAIGRVGIGPTSNAEQLLSVLARGEDKALPFTASFLHDEGWLTPWGQSAADQSILRLAARPFTTGALAFLNGSYWWQDYRLQARLNEVNAQAAAVISRYQDKRNYAICKYGLGGVRLEQVIDGQEILLARWKSPGFSVAGLADAQVGMVVEGNWARCLWRGQTIVSARRLSPRLNQGGVGFLVWDPVVNTAAMSVTELTVTPLP